MATGSTQTAVAKLGSDLMGDWSAMDAWYDKLKPEAQAAFKQALADAKAAGSSLAGLIHSVTPAPAVP